MRPDNFGWIVDSSHPIKPKPDKESWKDLAIGIGLTLLGVIWTAASAFSNGAHAFQDEETKILFGTGCIKPIDSDTVIVDGFDRIGVPKIDDME